MAEAERKGWNNDLCTAAMSSWPTPAANEYEMQRAERITERRAECKEKHGNNGFGLTLGQATQVYLAAWPTPRANDSTGAAIPPGRQGGAALKTVAGWTTPSASDGNGGKGFRPGVSMTGRMPDGSKVTMDLSAQVKLGLSSWVTPSAQDWKDTPGMATTRPDGKSRIDQLPRQVGQVVSGETPSGSTAGTASSGQLNPAFSRWLMGLPPVWDDCAGTGTVLSRRSRRRSSKPISKREVSDDPES